MEIIKWIIYSGLLLLPMATTQEAQYECGAHGRFEYCVDGIPGCIIGCHCHPGYYFDTETKICEPNTKLTQQYRRNFLSEPTRLQIPEITLPEEATPTLSTINPIDKKVEEIAKDTDDLGDWLYNQFFKTIENQVINNTDKGDLITRRSGKTSLNKKSKHKTRKFWKTSSKKKKNKKSGLRKKLLQITEDDSLFATSSSNSGSGSSSESGSDSSENESSSSEDENKTEGDKKSKPHGHKKFLFMNKHPKPPLPSFIFLPNMASPFYPPIGLPPPPVPMYPMVPVPPMGPFFPGFTPNQNDADTTSTVTTVATTTTTTTTTTTSDTPAPVTSDSEPVVVTSSRKRRKKNHGRSKASESVKENMDEEINEARNNFLHKLQKMKNRNKKQKVNDLMDQMQEADTPFLDYNVPGESLNFLNQLKPNMLPDDTNMQHIIPQTGQNMDDVGFKYLSELIHRVDLNNTNIKLDTPENIGERKIVPPLPQRRQNYNVVPSTYQTPRVDGRRHYPKPAGPEDLFYTSLGRQIASLIRKIDSNGEREINIELEQPNTTPVQSMLLQSRYAPRSYWERSVRSPVKFEQSNRYQFFQKSNENLFNLESKVEIFATTKPSFSLNELESIIYAMDRTKSEINRKINDNMSDTSNISLNINLLPKTNSANIDNRRLLTDIREQQNNNEHVNLTSTGYFNVIHPNRMHGIVISDIHKPTPQENVTKKPLKVLKPIRRIIDMLQTYQIPHKPVNKNLNKWYMSSTTKKPLLNRQYNNVDQYQQYNQPNLNYITNNNNQFMYEHDSYPVHKKYGKYFEPLIKPSYFHHEMHRFDFFD